MNTKCKSCIFGVFEDKKQTGCVLGKLDIYKEQGTRITREFSERTQREYYVINDRYCMACRSDSWLDSLPEGTDHLKKMQEEMAIQCQFIVMYDDDLVDLIKTCNSIENQRLKASRLTIADRPHAAFSDDLFLAESTASIRAANVKVMLERLSDFETRFEIRSISDPVDDGKAIDMCVDFARPQYYCVVQAGCEVPETMLEELNDFVTNKLIQFSLISADEHNNYMVVPFSVHQYLNGNIQKPLVEKLKEQEWESSVYPIHTVCPSTKM